MEAVPNELVFMRSKLFGIGPRDSQTYSHVQISGGPFIIEQSTEASSIDSLDLTIVPNIVPPDPSATFTFRVLDGRGLKINGNQNLAPDFNYPDVTPVTVTNKKSIVLNAKAGQITADKTIGMEVRRDGSAPAITTIVIKRNATAA